MSVNLDREFIDKLLYELAKKLNKQYKKIPTSITIVGGASIILQSSIRDVTEDIDIVKDRLLDLKQSALEIADNFNVNNDWINDNFMYSKSFSKKYYKYTKLYKKIYNTSFYILDLKAVACMKMIAGRTGTNDFTDIEGIIKETNLSKEEVLEILEELYGSDYNKLLNVSLDNVFNIGTSNLDSLFSKAINKMSIN